MALEEDNKLASLPGAFDAELKQANEHEQREAVHTQVKTIVRYDILHGLAHLAGLVYTLFLMLLLLTLVTVWIFIWRSTAYLALYQASLLARIMQVEHANEDDTPTSEETSNISVIVEAEISGMEHAEEELARSAAPTASSPTLPLETMSSGILHEQAIQEDSSQKSDVIKIPAFDPTAYGVAAAQLRRNRSTKNTFQPAVKVNLPKKTKPTAQAELPTRDSRTTLRNAPEAVSTSEQDARNARAMAVFGHSQTGRGRQSAPSNAFYNRTSPYQRSPPHTPIFAPASGPVNHSTLVAPGLAEHLQAGGRKSDNPQFPLKNIMREYVAPHMRAQLKAEEERIAAENQVKSVPKDLLSGSPPASEFDDFPAAIIPFTL